MKKLFLISLFCVSTYAFGIQNCIFSDSVHSVELEGREPSAYSAATSVAGFYPIANSGRVVMNFNHGWRFFRGDASGAESASFNDKDWEIVSTPHSVELEPAEASGCRNYQGVAWYRKHFTLPKEMKDKQATLYFEGAMGKQWVYVDGKLAAEHLGGYLPFMVNLSKFGVKPGDKCVIAVKVDNSDDKSFPPGKRQYTLDFSYHGGIYRDVWLIGRSASHITDVIEAGKVAGGGVFIHYNEISEKNAVMVVNTDVENSGTKPNSVTVENTIISPSGKVVKKLRSSVKLLAGKSATVVQQLAIAKPQLWSCENPLLYKVETRIFSGKQCIDGGMTRTGIRRIEFRGKDGLWINGKRSTQLVGANRHQDFAYVGNALPNSQQWRDAKRLRDAGCRIIRVAHYPQDPSFMDACDELGLFVIVATPGWQYWNKKPEFAQRVHQNTREIIRRDRNHPSVILWEPILNETQYPEDFALQALQITKDEYPYFNRPGAAADVQSKGVRANYDVVYGWPGDDEKADAPEQCIFTREFGENVDDWYAHNNDNRASRSWGERPMLVQSQSLAKTYDGLYRTTGKFIGGAQWHPFDHQRGYHPDPYWCGIYDAFRQKKTAYYMFRSQSPASWHSDVVSSGPMVYIAHNMTQFSDADVVVYSNCDSVRLTAYDGAHVYTLPVEHKDGHMLNAPVVFKNVWDFWEARGYSYNKKAWQKVKLVAEGIIGGKVVCREERMPSRRSTKLRLYADYNGHALVADGSDFIVVVAEVTDDLGHVRRLAKENIVFTVEGEGTIIGDESICANPRAVEYGSAPILVRSTRKAGKIKVSARVQFEGTHAPTSASIEFESIPSVSDFCDSDDAAAVSSSTVTKKSSASGTSQQNKLTEEEKQKLLDEVEKQQSEFGIQK